MSTCNVRDSIYSGTDRVLLECFNTVNELRRRSKQLTAILTAGKAVKGTLNEDQYDDRVAENANTDKLREIVSLQEHRRCEYFRTRMLLQYHLIPSVEALWQRAIALGKEVRARYNKNPFNCYLSLDELYALGEMQTVFEEEDVVLQLLRAKDFVVEPDETEGKGEKAFDRAFRKGDTWYQSAIPDESQIIDGIDAHLLDAALLGAVAELMPKLIEFERDIEVLNVIAPNAFQPKRKATPAESRRLPEFFGRARHRCGSGGGNPMEGYDPSFKEVEADLVVKALKALREAAPQMLSKEQRWLAQSNCMGVKVRVLSRIDSLQCDAHNLTLTSGGYLPRFTQVTVVSFDRLLEKLSAAGEVRPEA